MDVACAEGTVQGHYTEGLLGFLCLSRDWTLGSGRGVVGCMGVVCWAVAEAGLFLFCDMAEVYMTAALPRAFGYGGNSPKVQPPSGTTSFLDTLLTGSHCGGTGRPSSPLPK